MARDKEGDKLQDRHASGLPTYDAQHVRLAATVKGVYSGAAPPSKIQIALGNSTTVLDVGSKLFSCDMKTASVCSQGGQYIKYSSSIAACKGSGGKKSGSSRTLK